MTSEPTFRHPQADDGSWESLAENLFGIDFKQPGPGEDLAAEDLSLDDELLDPAAAPRETRAADSETVAAEMSGSADAADDFPQRDARTPADRDFEEDLGFEEDLDFDQPATAGAEDDEEDVRLIESAAAAHVPAASAPQTVFEDNLDDDFDADLDLSDEDEDAEPQADATPPEDDTYWDALKDWEWDDAEEPAAPAAKPGRRPPRGAATPRYVPRAVVEPEEPAWAEGRDEFIDDPDFAAGLLEDAPPVRGPSAAPLAPAAAGPEARPTSQRRRETREEPPRDDDGPRGRRRRRRRGRPEPAETTSGRSERDDPGTARSHQREEPEEVDTEDTDVDRNFEPPAGFDEAAEGDEFGLGLEVEQAPPVRDTDRGPRRGRRRRPRRREAPSAEGVERAAERPEPAAAEPAWEEAAEPERDDVDEVSPAARWEDIPTWEEAVALLVNPGRSGTREPSASEGGRSPRPSRPRSEGGRRPRRRR